MMPHPEAYHHRTNHPRWTREELPEEGMGIAFFRNGVGIHPKSFTLISSGFARVRRANE